MTRGGRGGSPFFPIGLSPTALTPVSLALFTGVAARMVAKPPLAARCVGVLQTSRYLHHPLRLLPAGATVAGRDSHPLKNGAFPRRTR